MGYYRGKVIASLVISVGGLATGLTGGILVPVTYFSNISYEVSDGYHHAVRTVVTSTFYGTLAGSLITGIVMNFLGRKMILNILMIPYVAGWLLTLLFEITEAVGVGRALIGLSFGGFSVITPIYLSEIAQTGMRGSFVVVFTLMEKVGFFLGFVLTMWQGKTRLELMSVVLFVSSSVLFIPSFFMVESPLMLILRNDEEEAAKAIKSVREVNHDVEIEMDEIRQQVLGLKFRTMYFKTPLKRWGNQRAFLTMMALCLIQQITFISAYMFWVAESSMMVSPEQNFYWLVVIIQIFVQMIGIFSCIVSIDKTGRRKLLLISSTGVLVSSVVLAGRILYFGDNWIENVNNIDMIFITANTIMHTIGLTPIPWVLTTELYTPEIKWFGSIMTSSLAWGRHLIYSEFLYFFEKQVVFRINVIVASIAAGLGVLLIFFTVLETTNRKLNEIHKLMNGDRVES